MSGRRLPEPDPGEYRDPGQPSGAQKDATQHSVQTPKRRRVRSLWYIACALGVLGIAALWVTTRGISGHLRLTRGGTVEPMLAVVTGTVVQYPNYDPESGTLTFTVDAGTRGTQVVNYRGDIQALSEAGKLPTIGDQLAVEGAAEAGGEAQALVVDGPDHLDVVRPEPIEVRIAEVSAEEVHHKVRVRGMVRQVKEDGPLGEELVIRDETGQISVVYDRRLTQLLGVPAEVVPGDSVSVRGVPVPDGPGLLIALDSADGLELLGARVPIAPLKAIGDIDAGDADQMACVEGTIVAIERLSGGRKQTLQDSTGGIALVLWQSILGDIADRPAMGQGAVIGVCGRISIYDGELEVLPESSLDVQVIRPVPMVVTRLALSEVNPGHVGQVVSTVGQIARVHTIVGGYWLALQEGHARLRLVLWESLFQACKDRDRLVAGAWVSTTGLVQAYEGVLEIVPERAEDVTFVAGGEPPPVETCVLSRLSQADVGRECQVEGRVVAIGPFAQGTRLTVDDGDGTITVVIWSDVLAQVRVLLEPGQEIQVRGEVTVYRDTLELVVAAPDDLVATSSGPQPTPTVGATQIPTPTPVLTPTATPSATATAGPTSTPRPTVSNGTATVAPATTASATPGVETVATGRVSQEHTGRQVRVQGRLAEVERFASGLRSIVDDGSGRLVVWVPEAVAVRLTDMERWAAGNLASVTGMVQDYKGQVELVPQGPEDLHVMEVATPGPGTVTRIGDVKTSDKGKWVTVEGTITTVSPFSQGIKYVLDDGSGRITLLLWQNVLDTIQGRERLAAGTLVWVTGKVDEYRGELEIAPGTSGDVAFR